MFAQVVARQPWTLGEIAVAIIVVIAVVAIVVIFVRSSGIPIPNWVWQILGVVLCAIVAVVAIRIVLNL